MITLHQFSISVSPGDGISNGMRLTRKLLRLAGIKSDIYCINPSEQMAGDVLCMDDYIAGSADALLVHHGIGNPVESWLRYLPERKFMVFHNITPGELFPSDHPIQPMLAHGWEQVDKWKSWLTGSIADSPQNLQELLDRGYPAEHLTEIPLLVDLEHIHSQPLHHSERQNHEPGRPFTLLYVSRVMPHKNQLGLVDAFARLLALVDVPLQLFLVGGFTVPQYQARVQARIDELGIGASVCLTGKVDDAELSRLYSCSDLFVSLSRHEGFGMPLIEAMAYGVPVLASDAPSSNVMHTLGGAGLLLGSDQPDDVAASILALIENPVLRLTLREKGLERVQEFGYQRLYDRLSEYLAKYAIKLPDFSFTQYETADIVDPDAGHSNGRCLAPENRELEHDFSS